MASLKVIFCTDGIFPHLVGGMQRHSRLLIESLAKSKQVDLIVIHPHSGEHIFKEFSNVKEIVIDPPLTKKNYLLERYDYSKEVYKILVEYPDHIIYSQGLSVWYKAKEFKNRLIINPHGLEPYQTLTLKNKIKLAPYRFIFNWIFNRSKYVVALGGKLTGILKNQISNSTTEVVVLPNAINAETVSPPQKEFDSSGKPVRVLFVGRFVENKGINILLEAISILNQNGEGKDFFFSLAGKGPLFEELKSRYHFENVEFLGFVADEDLMKLYDSHDVFVLPTLFEGMPTVVLEAMAYGMSIMVTDVGATKELVSKENGFIIPKKDPQVIVEKLRLYKNLPSETQTQMSNHSFEKVIKLFTWKKVAQMHIELFKKVT